MKPIIIVPAVETQHWKFFCNHFSIPYTEHDQPCDAVDHIVICDFIWLGAMWRNSRPELYTILKNNQMLLVGNSDAPVILKYDLPWLQQLDQEPESKNLTCAIEASWFNHQLQNISVDHDPESRFIDLVEQRITLKLSKSVTKDFLITFGRQTSARDTIYHGLGDIGKNSIMVYHGGSTLLINPGNRPAQYVGEDSVPMLWQKCMVPSLDLYNQCAFEISSETMTTEGSWFTEKTFRPIAAKMPLILMSVPGALKDLQNLGFKTFGDYIDESYDAVDNEQDRALQIVATVKDIVHNGSADFANAVQHITEHNWNRLVELKGRFQFNKDQRFLAILESLSLRPR